MYAAFLRRCVLLFCWACGLPAMAQTALNVGYVPAGDWLPALIAQDKGFFQKRQLNVTLTKVALISNLPAAIMSGSVDIGAATPPILIDAAEGGLGLVGLVGGTRLVKDPAVFSLVARPGAGINAAADLVGKRVGVPGVRSVGDVLLRKWLLDKGIDPKKVTFVEAPFPQMKDLLKGGTLDAVAVLEPFRSRILGDNTGVRVADYAAEVNPDLLGSVWIARKEWVSANARTAQAFKDSIAEAVAYIASHREEAGAIEQKYLGFQSPVALRFDTAVKAADLDAYVAIGKTIGYLRSPVDTGKLIQR